MDNKEFMNQRAEGMSIKELKKAIKIKKKERKFPIVFKDKSWLDFEFIVNAHGDVTFIDSRTQSKIVSLHLSLPALHKAIHKTEEMKNK